MSGVDGFMSGVDLVEVNEDFICCYNEAITHLQHQAEGNLKWFKSHPEPPFLEHISFYLGNQLFFIKLEDVDHQLEETSTTKGVLLIAGRCRGHACIMPMRKRSGKWAPAEKGWGLLDAQTRMPVNPSELKTDELIEMTDWELHDIALKLVIEKLKEADIEVTNWHSNPDIDPSLWFAAKSGPKWLLVRAVRYPLKKAEKPAHLLEIQNAYQRFGHIGYFASVLFTSLSETFDPRAEENGNISPLYRGEKMDIQFTSIDEIEFQ